MTVVSVLHDLSLALLADHLVIIDRGRLCASGSSQDRELHRVLIEVFGGAIRVERFEQRWIVIPHIDALTSRRRARRDAARLARDGSSVGVDRRGAGGVRLTRCLVRRRAVPGAGRDGFRPTAAARWAARTARPWCDAPERTDRPGDACAATHATDTSKAQATERNDMVRATLAARRRRACIRS